MRDILGSMLHKDAHDGPGGLYGPGGILESQFRSFDGYMRNNHGMSGMTALSAEYSGICEESRDTAQMELALLDNVVDTGIAGAMQVAHNYAQYEEAAEEAAAYCNTTMGGG